MKTYIWILAIAFLFISFAFTSSGKEKEGSSKISQVKDNVYPLILTQDPGDFYKKQCAFCHESEGLIAPDMKDIKKVYIEKFPNKPDFEKAMLEFVKHPTKEKALYKKGLDQYTLMPKMPFKEEDLKGVVEYIYTKI